MKYHGSYMQHTKFTRELYSNRNHLGEKVSVLIAFIPG